MPQSDPGEHSDFYCSQHTREAKVPLAGTAGFKPYLIVLELAEPWAKNAAASADFPAELNELCRLAQRHGRLVTISAIAPDPHYAEAGMRRIFFVQPRPPASAHRYERQVYVVPHAHTVAAVKTMLDLTDAGQTPFDCQPFRRPLEEQGRDLFVCAHAARDRCCGRWGRELFEQLRAAPSLAREGLRVWRSSHIGGHKFAPTGFELPSLRWWGGLSVESAEAILRREGSVSALADCYRGFAGLEHPHEQIAEGELFKSQGWAWLADDLALEAVSEGLAGHAGSKVELRYQSSSQLRQGSYTAEVRVAQTVETFASCTDTASKPLTVYSVRNLP